MDRRACCVSQPFGASRKEGRGIEKSGTSSEKAIWELLTGPTPVVVTAHVRIDGDALGAALALWHALRDAGQECRTFFDSVIPVTYDFLPGLAERAASPQELPERFVLAVLDTGSLDRIGCLAAHVHQAVSVLNIDHHATNSQFGDLNYVDPAASSSGEIVYRILEAGGAPLTKEIADSLYTAILTDTGRFSFPNTTPAAYEICGRLVEAGCRPQKLTEKIYSSLPESAVRLQALVLGTLKLEAGGCIATMELTEEMLDSTEASETDTQGFAEMPVSVRGVSVSALVKEMAEAPGRIKVCLRGRPSADGVDVRAVAEGFGGGGHRSAAGCVLEGDIERVRRVVVEKLCESLRQ
ncbi:MAG: bifunctional oligoribonuclease/PAP phosphatase NrnA [Candidatus Brocadiia bacterium]|nr:bifunctional oligoribonuclease/PAP phosphatase NrnA [Candidatus Brocadiia bacterium]